MCVDGTGVCINDAGSDTLHVLADYVFQLIQSTACVSCNRGWLDCKADELGAVCRDAGHRRTKPFAPGLPWTDRTGPVLYATQQ